MWAISNKGRKVRVLLIAIFAVVLGIQIWADQWPLWKRKTLCRKILGEIDLSWCETITAILPDWLVDENQKGLRFLR